MKRNEGCKGCVWNFGKPVFPCPLCEDYDLYFSWETGDKKFDCPICKSELRKTEEEPEYWMCDKCIKGFNREELKGARKKDAEVQEEDNAPNGL